ncbi:sigma-70 family RNA polymerase sigma factor [Stieleria sp. ICT_E10.1]|uniref:sigma-70 family RNA polymerase sigma factor n=1 Tax=Stieleria sedimenti TaxID=2976331 RepID=UPI00217FF84F|nr:sigma-70 family RNA polymerase sigma factor [Stieleria sedimenti]MCS7471632.1 sigma-70 family RNA polymerase sigma factor [Stieleria sedimenti]
MTAITTILSKIDQGDPSAAEELLPLVYDELRTLAAARMACENPGHTLQATALVHEAYLRPVKDRGDVAWDSRGHFFASAAEAMRRILIDRARQKQRPKHGGDRNKLDLEIHCPASDETPDRLLAINEALAKLEQEQPEMAELVKLRYFAGVPLKDAAPLLGVSLATAKRRWAFARAFLYDELAD